MSSYYRTRLERRAELPSPADALAAVEQGFWIFPVTPFDKKPHPDVSSWASWATCSTRDIRRNWPEDGANIGIACKLSGLLVVDPDRHAHDGVKAWTMLCEEHEADGDWPDTYTVRTPTNGYHLVFANPDPERYGNSRGSLPEGIDVRGGGEKEGGYVLAAGSVVDRRAYKGKPELQALVGDGRAYVVDNDAKVIQPPGWLTDMLDADPPAGRRPAKGGGEVTRRPLWSIKVETPYKLGRRLDGALQKLRDEGSGNRNELCFWTACTFGEVVAAGRMDLADAEADLMAAMEDNGFIAGHDEYSALATIHNGFTTAGASW